MSLLEFLDEIFKESFSNIGIETNGRLVKLSDRPDLSQFQCNVAFEKAKELRKNPREIAERVVEELRRHSIFKDVSVAGPGFINITLTNEFLTKHIE